uniref:Uncharacterized protein n=1 Tax=Cacopsylla melanoneura TaxID=428564 RepID=A0A8D9BHR6_9HEMI
MLPKYWNWSTLSMISLSTVSGVLILQLILISLVFDVFILSPTFRPSFFRSWIFPFISSILWLIKQMSSAKSRSSICWVSLHCMPLGVVITLLITPSRTMRKIIGEIWQPCLTPVCTWKGSLTLPSCITRQL